MLNFLLTVNRDEDNRTNLSVEVVDDREAKNSPKGGEFHDEHGYLTVIRRRASWPTARAIQSLCVLTREVDSSRPEDSIGYFLQDLLLETLRYGVENAERIREELANPRLETYKQKIREFNDSIPDE